MSGSSQTRVIAPPISQAVEARPVQASRAPATAEMRPRDSRSEDRTEQSNAPGMAHAFRAINIHAGLPVQIQARLVVGQPGDRYEQEADRAADLVTGAAAPQQLSNLAAEPSTPLRRQPAEREDEEQREGDDERELKHRQAIAQPNDLPEAPPGLARQIEGASAEGQPLPAAPRGFYEQRFGHDFGAVRVYAGPRAAAAATAAGAQAFTRGQNIYFGAGYYRPETSAGKWLMAHELAHTVQQRPGVIARRALAEPEVAEAPAGTAPSGESVELLATDLLGILHSGQAGGNNVARERLRALDLPTQLSVLARVRSRLPPPERPSVATLLENALGQRTGARPALQPSQTVLETSQEPKESPAPAQGSNRAPSPDTGTPAAVEPHGALQSSDLLAPTQPSPAPSAAAGTATGEEMRPAERSPTSDRDQSLEVRPAPAPAPVTVEQVPEAPPTAGPVSGEQSAQPVAAAAAETMQSAIRSATDQAGPEAPATTDDDATGSQAGRATDTPEAGQVETAAQAAVSAFNDQLAELGQIRGSRIRFEGGESNFSSDPKELTRREQSESLASGFIEGIAQQVEPIIAAGLNAVPQVLTSLTGAKETVRKTMTEQATVVHDGAETARKRVGTAARQVRGQVEKKRGESDSAADRGAQSAQDRAKTAQKSASGEIDKQAKEEEKDISKKYVDAASPTKAVGTNAGGEAKGAANKQAQGYRDQFNGESSVLDGPIHDDRLEAQADTAVTVGQEYAKSFQESANDQANKLPESKPEVLGKISEITGQAKTGLDDQLKQMTEGVDAFSRSAHTRAGQTNNQIKSSATTAAKQTVDALNGDEEQQTTALMSQGTAQQQALDDAVSSGLGSLTGGVTQAISQITQSMNDFSESAAAMAPPDPEDLSPVLEDVTGQTSAAVIAMGQQVQTVGPTMDATLATARDQTVKSLSDASAAARQKSGSAADAFGGSMRGLSQQATKGFDTLIEGDTKTAGAMGQNAEQGFDEAAKGSKKAFGLFGEKVDENFREGREQLFNNLWSKQNQEKLSDDIRKYGKEAAARVQPRWKKVLKWVVTIVVIIAVIAITVLSAGSLGPVGVVLLGAALGAAAGAVTTIAHNLIDGKKWSDGVAKAMIVGAIGGAFGGAGGVLLKGVGSVALRIGLEAGINVVGGITGEVAGSLAVGETINWTGAVVGALIGAGVGAGLGIAGALRGKIRLGSTVEAPAPVPPRPPVEVPPPAGRLRTVLEQTRILAPRSAPAIPEGAAAAATTEAVPPPGQEPRIGFGPEREAARAAQPRPPAAQPQTERIGFGREAVREAQPRPPGAQPQTERIGFGREAVREAQPRPPGAQPQTERIGFGREAVREAQPRPPVPQAPPGAEAGRPADLQAPTAVRQPVAVEAGLPRPGAPTTSGEPGRVGGQAPEIRASAKPGGGGGRGSRPTQPTPRRGRVTPVEEATPAQRSAERASVEEPGASNQGGPREAGQDPARSGSRRGGQTSTRGNRGGTEQRRGGRSRGAGEERAPEGVPAPEKVTGEIPPKAPGGTQQPGAAGKPPVQKIPYKPPTPQQEAALSMNSRYTARPRGESRPPQGYEDVLEQPGVSERRTPGGAPSPEKAEVGNFAHRNFERLGELSKGRAEEFIPASKLKPGLPQEVEIPHPDYPPGKRPRIDRLDSNAGEVIEIKPDTPYWRKQGQAEAQQYAEWMNKYGDPPANGGQWKPKVVFYDLPRLQAFLKKIGYLE